MNPDLEKAIRAVCTQARRATQSLATLPSDAKTRVLEGVSGALRSRTSQLLEANEVDMVNGRARGLSDALLDRLRLTPARIEGIAQAVSEIAALEDPVGSTLSEALRPNGLRVRRVRVPIGVIGIIYEARPNVTIDAAALCFKAGNAVILRGGSEALASNTALARLFREVLAEHGVDPAALSFLETVDREAIRTLISMSGLIDLVIPRGGEGLIHYVTEHARVPVVQHYKGVCHLYVDEGADIDMAIRLAVNGKLSRPSVCNALECLLIDAGDAARLLPPIVDALREGGCSFRACERSRALIPELSPADPEDFGREFLDRVLSIRLVEGLDGALSHIAEYGSFHTEAICTSDAGRAERFRREVDAACVMVNASTRFHDGGELGLGAEIGIATSRLHWRGAMGLESLTTFKWLVDGDGQVRT